MIVKDGVTVMAEFDSGYYTGKFVVAHKDLTLDRQLKHDDFVKIESLIAQVVAAYITHKAYAFIPIRSSRGERKSKAIYKPQ